MPSTSPLKHHRHNKKQLNPQNGLPCLTLATDTQEGLYYPTAVVYYSRIRFIANLLPLLQRAPALRRVVSVFAGTKEGPIRVDDFPQRHVPMRQQRGHLSSMTTLALESLALEAPDVSFVHDFPGSVKTDLGKDVRTAPIMLFRAYYRVIGPIVNLPYDEAGERQLFFATSARFPPRLCADGDATAGVPLPEGVGVAQGSDGLEGSGVYTISCDGEPLPQKARNVLQKLRRDDVTRKLWLHTEAEFTKATGTRFVC